MALKSPLLSGNDHLEMVLQRRFALYSGSRHNREDAVRLIQSAVIQLGFPLPVSTRKTGSPDGIYGNETREAVRAFQYKAFPAMPGEWDGKVGPKTLARLDEILLTAKPAAPPAVTKPVQEFICGPDVTEQVVAIWRRIQADFRARSDWEKFRLGLGILLPLKYLDSGMSDKEVEDARKSDSQSFEQIENDIRKLNWPGADKDEILRTIVKISELGLDYLRQIAINNADIASWEVMPLFQGSSNWLERPPIHIDNKQGPLATPTYKGRGEDPATCSHSVQVAGKCWLNGSVNYGTFGIMVRLVSDFARSHWFFRTRPEFQAIFSLQWAEMLIRAYKAFSPWPEDPTVPLAWTRATYHSGPTGTPGIPGNRPKCKCKKGPTGAVVRWDYVWEPLKNRRGALDP